MKHVVMFSAGIGSWATARRVAEEHGTKDLVLLFADVKGKTDDPHIGEDEDAYRFARDAAENIGTKLITVMDGRNIWDVFKDDRYLGNTRLANCSKFLKQIPCRNWLKENYSPDEVMLYIGIDWSEMHRVPEIQRGWLPYRSRFPMTEPPYLDKDEMIAAARAEGLEPPRLYEDGFSHNNCGGGCVRAGQGQFARLLQVNPERYAVWERKEEEVRQHIKKDVSILRDRRGGKTKPMTLRAFRERIESKAIAVDVNDIGGCGCFVSEPIG